MKDNNYAPDKPDNYTPSDKLRSIIDTLDCVKEELGCDSVKKIGLNKFSRIFSQHKLRQLNVADAESVKFLRIHSDDLLELTVKKPQIRFLRIEDKLYYTI